MSGAQLENAGQVRNNPYLVNESFRVDLSLTVANSFTDREPITFDGKLPFDLGPDKSGRVFTLINGIYITVRADVGNTSQLRGALYFQGLDGRKTFLHAFCQNLDTSGNAYKNEGLFIPSNTLNADSVSVLGHIGFDNIVSVIGTATEFQVFVWLNIGFYNDYAEPNWNTLFKMSRHEHIGMDYIEYLDEHRESEAL